MSPPLRCLTLSLTNRCPLRCSHCGPRSGPDRTGDLDEAVATAALRAAARRGCEVVNFSGGEPFAAGAALERLVAAARALGLLTRVTTGAAWSPDPARARARLEPLARAGLSQLYVSVSAPHQAAIPLGHALAATAAARELGVEPTIVATAGRGGEAARQVRAAFLEAGATPPWILPTPLIPFGRGAEGLRPEDLDQRPVEELSGPCPSLALSPAIHPDGTITGCASVFAADLPALAFGRAPATTLEEALARLEANPLAAWIRGAGVVALKRLVEGRSEVRLPERAVNICHLCGEILGHPGALAAARRLLAPS